MSEKTKCGYVEENGDVCPIPISDDDRPTHMFHVHGIPSATIIHEEPAPSPTIVQEPKKYVNPILANALPALNRHERQEARKEYADKEREQSIKNVSEKPNLTDITNKINLKCPKCQNTTDFSQFGKNNQGKKQWRCNKCKYTSFKMAVQGAPQLLTTTNENRLVHPEEKHKRKYKKRADIEVWKDHSTGKIKVEAPGKKEDSFLENSTIEMLLKESQTAHKALDVLLPMIIGTGNSTYLIDALAELHDLRQEKKNGGNQNA